MNHEFESKKHRVATTYRIWTTTANDKEVCVQAGREIKKGEELFTYYGTEPIVSFFPKYGFLHDDVETDKTYLFFPGEHAGVSAQLLSDFDPDLKFWDTIRKVGANFEIFQVLVGVTETTLARALPVARLWSFGLAGSGYSEEERKKIVGKCLCEGEPDFNACGVSPENEQEAINVTTMIYINSNDTND